jgi:hypothetical protein
VWCGHVGFQTERVENDDQLLELGRDRINLLGNMREQPALPSDPATPYRTASSPMAGPLAPLKPCTDKPILYGKIFSPTYLEAVDAHYYLTTSSCSTRGSDSITVKKSQLQN